MSDAYAEQGLPAEDVPARVRFGDLDFQKFPQFRPLKIIATDVQSRQGILFSRASHPTVEIAAVVAASVAIPGVFQPVALRELPRALFVDGGLVSNCPTWAFIEEKLAYERRFPKEDRVAVIAFMLAEPPDDAASNPVPLRSRSIIDYLSATIRSGIFGSQEVGQRFMADLVQVPLRPDLGVLGFDAPWPAILGCFNAGRRDAMRAFARSLRLRPERIRQELKLAVDGARSLIDQARATVGRAPISRVRGAIVAPTGAGSLRVMVTYGAQTEADDNLLLDRNGPGCARAFRERDIIVVRVDRDAAGRPLFMPETMMTRYEAALMWAGLQSMACVPILVGPGDWAKLPTARTVEPLGVLSLDSDEDLEPALNDPALRRVDSKPTCPVHVALGLSALVPCRRG